jgi:hypothetical protein
MAGRDERQGPDVDDWFDEPQSSRARRTRGDVAQAVPSESADDWLGEGTGRTLRRPRVGVLGDLSDRGRAITVIAVSLVVLLFVGLALGGVFSGSKPHPATLTLETGAGTTAPTTTATKPSTVAAPSVPLKPGDSGAQVKVLQAALASLGYSPGTIDGVYGTSTQNAVVQFQKAAGLTADGVVGPATRRALRTALAKK